MMSTCRLRSRTTTPPKGFTWKTPDGYVARSITFRGLLEKCRPYIPRDVDPSAFLDARVASQLVENGHPELVEQVIPRLSEQGFGQVVEIDSSKFLSPGAYYYNAGLADFDGKLLMVYRRQQQNGHSDIVLCEIDRVTLQPIPETNKAIDLPKNWPTSTYEDPSLVVHDGKLLMAYCEWQGQWHYAPAQHLCEISSSGDVIESFDLTYGRNHHHTEKSWMFFSQGEDDLRFAYYPNPLEIVKFDQKTGQCLQTSKHAWDTSFWKWGQLRGSCPPVRIGDEYLFIIHSAHRNFERRLTYVVGAMCFDAETFKPTRALRDPILSGNHSDRGLSWAPMCVFPRGLVVDAYENCILSLGVNDLWTAMVRFNLNHLLGLMKPL